MNLHILHDVTFYALYGFAVLGLYVVVERLIYFTVAGRDAGRLAAMPPGELKAQARRDAGRGPGVELLSEFLAQRTTVAARHDLEDLTEGAYIHGRAKLQRRLWIVDTMVTAAPLLGLLGTIFGIIDTFQALASSGISDPAAVSRGIGTALFATALGIGVALVGLIANNYLNDRIERVADLYKMILLKAGQGGPEAEGARERLAAVK